MCEIASIRQIAAMKLEDGLVQAKTRLQTLNIAIQAANDSELEHEQVKIFIIVAKFHTLSRLFRQSTYI